MARHGRFYRGDGVFDDGVNIQRPEFRGRPGGIPVDAVGATELGAAREFVHPDQPRFDRQRQRSVVETRARPSPSIRG